MVVNKEDVLKIVDECFHTYASDFRQDAKKMALEELERILYKQEEQCKKQQ